jgi:hypothetical protein
VCSQLTDMRPGHPRYGRRSPASDTRRHNPRWTHRHWVTTPQWRLDHVGRELNCSACGPDVLGMTA